MSGARPSRSGVHSPTVTPPYTDSAGDPVVTDSELEMVTTLVNDKAAWVVIPIAGWANESFQVTRRKSVQCCVRVGTKCVYQQGNETFSEGEEEKVVVVNVAYLEQHVPFVRDRLKRAGIRLAHLLNSTLGH